MLIVANRQHEMAIALDCPWRGAPDDRRGNQYTYRCHARFPDIERLNPLPPDLPPAMSRPRLIQGGKK